MTNEQRKTFEKKVRNAIYNTWHDNGIANVDGVARIAVGAISVELSALSTQAELLKACEWQPIETAPKDGTAFVGSNGKYAYRTMLGRYYVKWPHEEGGPTYAEKWNKETGDSVYPWKPTHWMPLPPCPNQD